MTDRYNNPLAIVRFDGTNDWKVVTTSDSARGISADFIIFTGKGFSKYDEQVVRECTATVKSKQIIEAY